MDFELSVFLICLLLAFALGWMASRMDLRQLRIENRQAPKAYFKGLNFLLNEQQDQAIDAFIEAVQNDPDTSELHFALGNLFRRRGEYERAVRVHQHLLSRGDLTQDDQHRAQHALALDYLKAGLLDRAESALLKLEGTRFETQARLALLASYERSRDWAQAAGVARKLEDAGHGSFAGRLAHYLCEESIVFMAKNDAEAAKALLENAIDSAPGVPRPRMELAAIYNKAGETKKALQVLTQAVHSSPNAMPLIAPLLASTALATGDTGSTLDLLTESYEQTASLDVLDAIVHLHTAGPNATSSARDWYARHLDKEPSLVAASKWIAGEKMEHEAIHPKVQRALENAVKPLTRYRCAACGFEAKVHFWQCPGCQAWDSYPARRVEEL